MLFLLFALGPERYALEAGRVVEVLPLVKLKGIPGTLPEVAGLLRYRGTTVPVIDLCVVALGRPAARRLSTRIVLVRSRGERDDEQVLGLIAESATETMRREPAEFTPSGIANDATPYLGPVTADAGGLVQWVDVDRLLPEPVRELLFAQPAAR